MAEPRTRGLLFHTTPQRAGAEPGPPRSPTTSNRAPVGGVWGGSCLWDPGSELPLTVMF